jgi:hypothetical protein
VVVISLFSLEFKHFYLNLIFNEFSIKVILKLKDILAKGQENYSYTCFILFHFYIAFSIFHFLMLFVYEVDVPFELIYQLLNLVRLCFFPLFLLMITLTFFPNFFKMEGLFQETSQKVIAQAAQQLLDFLKQTGNLKKNPKSAAVLYTITAGGIGAVAHKHSLLKQHEDIRKALNLELDNLPNELLNTPEGFASYERVLAAVCKINGSSITLSASDVKRFFTGNPTLANELSESLLNLKLAATSAEVKKEMARENALQISMSPSAKILYNSEVNSSSSEITKIPTIIEKLVFDN